MRQTCNLCKTLAAAAVFALLTPLTAVADMHGEHSKTKQDQADLENAVSAQTLLGADVRNVANPIGNVRDLILNEDRTAIEYVLYEVPYPYSLLDAQNGFVAFDNIAIEAGATLASDLRIDDEAARGPEELNLNRREADHRLVSRILEDHVVFADGQQVREVEDILVDRESGKILGYVVNRNPDAWFNEEPLMVPPHEITIRSDGNVTTGAEFAALESLK